MPNSRRQVLIGIAGSSALLSGADQHQNHHHSQAEPSAPAAAYVPKVFSAADLRTIGALAETIIPRTKTPGALDAKVHEIIDEDLSGRKAAQATWRKGLAEVNSLSVKLYKKPYADLEAGDQAAVMTELAARSKFFQVLKDATIDAYYSTKEGLQTELGWNAALPMPEFKGCTHPEHQS
jgi:hypothetical protein